MMICRRVIFVGDSSDLKTVRGATRKPKPVSGYLLENSARSRGSGRYQRREIFIDVIPFAS
jgi:hypothetical protein